MHSWLTLVLLTSVLVLPERVGSGVAQDMTMSEFIARYGVRPPPDAAPQREGGQTKRVEAEPFFDEDAARKYRYAPSIRAMRDLFRQRADETPVAPDRRMVQEAIDETFGVSRLGTGFTLDGSKPIASTPAGTIELVEFSFARGALGQALVGRPAKPNGALLVAVHGCLSSPDDVMLETGDYARAFGRRALERGYTVVAPYVFSACMWIHNADWIGSLSGLSVFGYELSKLGHVTRWAAEEFETQQTIVWGISLGGQYAMLASALYDDRFDVTVISGAAPDYEAAYRRMFDDVGLDGRAARVLGANTQVGLSAHVARRDVITTILPRRIVFEISTADLKFAPTTMNIIDYVDRAARRIAAAPPAVVLFRGTHGTNPRETLSVLDSIIR